MRNKTLLATAATALLLSTGVSAASLQLDDGFFASAVNGNKVSINADSHNLSSGKQVISVSYEENIIHSSERNDYRVIGPMLVVFDADPSATYKIVKKGDAFEVISSNNSVNAKFLNEDQAIKLAVMEASGNLLL